jgi:hypothetical protein
MRETLALLRAEGYQGSVSIGEGQLNQTVCDYVDADGNDTHGAGAVRFDTKVEGGPAGEDPERIYNYVRLVRDADSGVIPPKWDYHIYLPLLVKWQIRVLVHEHP